MERDVRTGIARITIDNPARRNSYNATMRRQLTAFLDELATDDDIKVVLLRGSDGTFSAGADMRAAYAWSEPGAADGLVIAKEAFRLVEQLQAYQGEEVTSYLIHAFGTNLRFEDGEFNFVKTRAEHGVKRAFELRDLHFEVPES
jgi:enoyl-CoA hydratase/carnithine racemase